MNISYEMHPAFQKVREALLSEFPKEKNTDLDTERVEAFIEAQGLIVKPYIIFKESELPKIKELVGSTGVLKDGFGKEAAGIYAPEIDLPMVRRNQEYDEANGPVYSEGILAHELAHASSKYPAYVKTSFFQGYTARVGFALPEAPRRWGWFFEEGFAEYMRGKYVKQNMGFIHRIKEALQFDDIETDDTLLVTTKEKSLALPLWLPLSYFTPAKNLALSSSSNAATGLDFLIRTNPKLLEALIQARYDVSGLRRLAMIINKLKPNLYTKLQNSEPTEDDFRDKLRYLTYSLFNDPRNIIRARGRLREEWEETLAHQESLNNSYTTP